MVSFHEMVQERKIPVLLYQADTALRFDSKASKVGVDGILNVMRAIGMLPQEDDASPQKDPYIANSSYWVRAPLGGIFLAKALRRSGPQRRYAWRYHQPLRRS